MNEGRFTPTLGGAVVFKWRRSDAAQWVDGSKIRDYAPRWDEAADDDEWYELGHEDERLGLADPWLVVGTSTEYQPLRDHEALAWEFASLPFSRNAYLEFARRYGPLTRDSGSRLPDRLSFWMQEHTYFQYAVTLYRAIQDGATDDLDTLGIRVRPVPKGGSGAPRAELVASASFVPNPPVERLIEEIEAEFDSKTADALRNRIVTEAAYALIEPDASSRRIVQVALSTILTGSVNTHSIQPCVNPDTSPLGMGLSMSFGGQSLVGAMWLQLALAAAGNQTFRSCPVCGTWWNARGARSHKTVCSNKCRAKQSYERRKAAKQGATNEAGPS